MEFKESRDPKEEAGSPEVLLEQWINLEGAKKTGCQTTRGSRQKEATKTNSIRISRILLGWISGNVGDICNDQEKILVEEYVQGCS